MIKKGETLTREKGNYTRTGGGTTVFDREELMKRMMEDEEPTPFGVPSEVIVLAKRYTY